MKSIRDSGTGAPPAPPAARRSSGAPASLLFERLGVFGILGLMLLTLWLLVLWFSAFQKQRQLEEASRELERLGSAVAQHTAAQITAVDADLRIMDQWLQANPLIDPLRDPQFIGLVDGMRQSSAGLVDLHLVGVDGSFHLLPAREGQPGANARDRPYFQGAMKLGPGKMYIAPPVLGRVTGKWSIPVARQLAAPVGGMQLAVATLDLGRLQLSHESYRLLPLGTVSVLRDDGIVLSRTPFDAKLMGKDLSDQPFFAHVRQQPQGDFVAPGVLTDGLRRLVRYQHLDDYPLIVSVTRGEEDVLAGYYERRRLVLAMVLAITFLSLFFAWRLQRIQRASRLLRIHAQHTSAMLLAAKNALPLGQFQADAQGHLVSVNEAWRQIHRLSAEALPATWAQAVDRAQPGFQAKLGTGGYLPDGEHELCLADGRRIHLRVRQADIVVEGGVIGCSGIVEDVTRQREGEKAQRMLMEALDHSTDIVVQSDLAGNLLYVNATTLRFFGYEPGTPVAQLDQRVLAGDGYFERRERDILPTAQRQGFWQGETTLRTAQGKPREFNHLLLLHRDADGEVSHTTGILRDITEQKRAERALAESGQLMHAIADRLPMRVSFVDRHQCYRFLNVAYERAFGKPRDALYGHTVREVLGEAAYQRVRPYLERALQGEAVTFEGEIATAESYQSYRADYIPQFDATGQATYGCVAIITDTTDQKQKERRLVELSQRDPLTGLYNRAGFDNRLRDALARAKTDNASVLALFYLDMDGFKQINDSLGHQAGDLLLQGFASRLTKALRVSDTVARLGGDEFAVLIEALDSPASVVRLAQNIVDAMRLPFVFEDKSVPVTTSIGVALHAGRQVVAAPELIRRADEQLYRAKNNGRNCFAVEPMPARADQGAMA